MKSSVARSNYQVLLADMSTLYERARQSVAEMYWRMGKRLVEGEQGGRERAEYGTGLLQRLSADLSAKYGRGFSVDNLQRMRQLYLDHPNSAASRKLTWSQYVEIMPVRDAAARKALEMRAQKEDLSARELRRLAVETGSAESAEKPEIVARPRGLLPAKPAPIRRPPLRLHTYRLGEAAGVVVPQGQLLIDCGFCIYRLVPKSAKGYELTPRPAYTYEARVERVIDGDTVWAVIDVGFGTSIREKLRLHGIDAAALGTEEGEQALEYVAGILKPGTPVIIRTYASDMYGRFVADIFYSLPAAAPKPNDLSSLAFLNNDLLSRGLAVRMVET